VVEAVKGLLEDCWSRLLDDRKKLVVGSDSEMGDNVLFAFTEPNGVEIPAFVGEPSCLVGDRERAGDSVELEAPGIGGNVSQSEAPKEELGLNGVMPAKPVACGWMVPNDPVEVELKLGAWFGNGGEDCVLFVGGGEAVPFRWTPVNMEATPPIPGAEVALGVCIVGDEVTFDPVPPLFCMAVALNPPGLLKAPLESSCNVGIFGMGGGEAALGIPNGFRLPV